MTPAARLQTSIELSKLVWDGTDMPMDKITNDFFRTNRHIGAKDRADIGDRVYSVMRHHARLDWWCTRVNTSGVRMRTLMHTLLVEGVTFKDLQKLCDGDDKYGPQALTHADCEKLAFCDGAPLDHPDMPHNVRFEYPASAGEFLRRALGDNLDAYMEEILTQAPIDLRVNTLKTPREGALKFLRKNGIMAEPIADTLAGLRVHGRANIAGTKAYGDGWIEVQDEGSQRIAMLCDAEPGQQVMDYCAGAGGKTLALAAMMDNKGRIVAMDTDAKRLEKGKARYRKAGVHNVEVRPLSDDKQKSWVKRQKGKFDCVLVDAPCSASGTWRRHPDLRWRPLGPALDALIPLQAQILREASKLVKPGGHLVYATCSINHAENEDQIASFMADFPSFTIVNDDRALLSKGFYACKLCLKA